ncbi:hypothetical protein [Paraburkholderia sp. SIMBA_030]|uniref:hypothetical protein n=1 Tax=Paraburkholderia sp. SIMBA_030 TaxID=3085773 RepID=UPI00397A2053
MNAELKFTALGGDKILPVAAGAGCSQYGSGNDYRQRSTTVVEQCAFGDANHGGSLSPKGT